jgi:hypothetical protein
MKQTLSPLAAALATMRTTMQQLEKSGAPAAARIAAAHAASLTTATALGQVMYRTRSAVEALREAGFDTSSQEAVRKAAEQVNIAVMSPEVQATLQALRGSTVWAGLVVTEGQPLTPEQERRKRQHESMQATFQALRQASAATMHYPAPRCAPRDSPRDSLKYLRIPRGVVRGQG